MELVHQAGDNGFHDGHGGGHRRKGDHHKEQDADDCPHPSHLCKNLRQGDKHESRSGGHALGSHENIDGRDDHQTRKQGDHGIKNLDLVDGRHQIHVLFHVRAVCYHDAHGDADGVKQLTQRIHNYKEKLLQGYALKIGEQIYFQPIQAGSLKPGSVRVLECQRVKGNTDNQDKKQRHDKFTCPFNAFVYAAEDNNRGKHRKNDHEDHGADLPGDKPGKITVSGGVRRFSGDKDREIL